MQLRDYLILTSTITSFILTIVSLVAGHKHGAAENITILTFPVNANHTFIYPVTPVNSSAVPATNTAYKIDDVQDWLVSLHYLSICVGYVGGDTSSKVHHSTCIRRSGGFTFRLDDAFIRETINSSVSSEDSRTVHTAAPFATLVIGLVFLGSSSLMLLYSALPIPIFWTIKPRTHLLSLAPAATFMAISAIAISVTISHHNDSDAVWHHKYIGWTRSFLGITWSAVGLLYIALILKTYDLMKQRERIRALREDSD